MNISKAAESKPVKQEVRRTVILFLTKKVSVEWCVKVLQNECQWVTDIGNMFGFELEHEECDQMVE